MTPSRIEYNERGLYLELIHRPGKSSDGEWRVKGTLLRGLEGRKPLPGKEKPGIEIDRNFESFKDAEDYIADLGEFLKEYFTTRDHYMTEAQFFIDLGTKRREEGHRHLNRLIERVPV